jgi:hypothetical protein
VESDSEDDGDELVEGTVGEKIRAQKDEERVREITDPRKPTQKELDRHCLTHLPYRNWCAVCVAGRGRDLDHRKDVREDRGLPEFAFDYAFPGDEFGYKLTILVGRERVTGMTFATVVPEKGSKGRFVADRCLEFFVECGCRAGDIVIKTDQEAAIAYLVKDLVAERGDEPGCRTLVEQSPVGSSGSNGVVERAVQAVEGQVRVLKLALEDRLGMKVSATSNIVAFLAEYAAYLLNRLEVGKDGKTAVERNKGKSSSVMGVEFGEKLMYKKRVKDKSAKIEPRWEKGIFVGVRVSSGEFWIATPEGIRKARSVRRLPVQDRWGEDSLRWVRHAPWHLYRGDSRADGEIPEEQVVDPSLESKQYLQGALPGQGIIVKTRQVAPRAFQIRKEDAEKHGYTRGCAGCTSWFRGLGRQPHNPQCRTRFEGLLREDARFQNAERRRLEYEDKIREKAAKKARKEEERGKRRDRHDDEAHADAPSEPAAASSSSSLGLARPISAASPSHEPAGSMEVDDSSPTVDDQNREFWEPLLKKMKKSREQGDIGMDVAAVVAEIVSHLELLPESENFAIDEDEISEVRAELIEELVNARFRSSDSSECFSAAAAAVFSPDDECYVSKLPDIYGRIDGFGMDASAADVSCLRDSRSVLEHAHCGGESSGLMLNGFHSKTAVRWADMPEDSEDLAEYVEGYWRGHQFATDDVHGGVLDLEKVKAARREEVDFMKSKGIWKEVPVSEAWAKTGKAPVSVKWVDTEKSGGVVRCRLVARDFKTKGEKDREDLFAATPPLELLKALLSKAAGDRRRRVLVIDVKKAHLYPLCTQDVYIELPEEAAAAPGTCGKLVHWLYGFRPAAQAWENHYAENLQREGFIRGVASPVAFWNEALDVSCLVHGDDFTFVGRNADLDAIENKMREWYEIKVKARLGPGRDDAKEVDVLGRLLRCTEEGYEYEADRKHRQIVMETLGFDEKSKGIAVNGRIDDSDDSGEELQGPEATSFRALAARVNYLSQDSPDVQYAAKEVCREMSKPTTRSWRKLKVLARFLLEREAVVWKYAWQCEGANLSLYTDSDWAGCRRTRKSTSGGLVLLGEHCLKTWSSTQAPIALSSAEAEYYAMVEGTSRCLGLRSMLLELGIDVQGPIQLHSDSAAARSFASRRGLGKMRHLETRHLWLQAEVTGQRVVLRRVPGEENPADLLTKYLGVREVCKCLNLMSVVWIARDRKAIAGEGGCQNPRTQQGRNQNQSQ